MEPLNQNLPIDDRIFVSLLEDSGFKAVMADKANKQLLIGLLNEVLPPHDHIVDIVQYRFSMLPAYTTGNSRKTKSTGSSSRSMSSVSSPRNLPSKKKTAKNPTRSLQGI